MPLLKSPTSWVHWLEAGEGAQWLGRGATMLAIVVLSLIVAHTQFRGPLSEETLRQASAARQWAEGRGYATPVNDPQLVAWHEQRGIRFDIADPYPELRHPPLYPAVLAGALALLPEERRKAWLGDLPMPPDGFGGDYVLLAVNVMLLWLAAAQTWSLGRRLFSDPVGRASALALMVSAALWAETVAVTGLPLAMVLLLGLAQAMTRGMEANQAGRGEWAWWGASGVAAGLLFLVDYPAGVLTPLVAVVAAWRQPLRRRLGVVAIVCGAALLVSAPWMIRNLTLTGNPVGLAWHDVALRSGDPTAEPDRFRGTFGTEAPAVELRKLGNKGLTALQSALQEQIWAGGLFLTGLFGAGWLYRFQRGTVRRLRAWFTLSLAGLVLAHGLFNSGEGERLPALYATPLLLMFGAGFFRVLIESNPVLAARPRLAWLGLLGLQALPLLQDVLEPRRVHFSYPPYHPGVFVELSRGLQREVGPAPGLMSDVPAGTAWYSGLRVWGKPATLREFHLASVSQPIEVLVLTPHTLDRPFFDELLKPSAEASRFGDWGRLYMGLIQDRLPAEFPLNQQQKLADNFRVLSSAGALRPSVK